MNLRDTLATLAANPKPRLSDWTGKDPQGRALLVESFFANEFTGGGGVRVALTFRPDVNLAAPRTLTATLSASGWKRVEVGGAEVLGAGFDAGFGKRLVWSGWRPRIQPTLIVKFRLPAEGEYRFEARVG
jgi:hypothetical protein